MDQRVSIILQDYYKKKELYQELALAVKVVLENILKSNEIPYIYQGVFSRVKAEGSLLIKVSGDDKYTNLDRVHDVAGCRIIFYLAEDINKFYSSLEKAFEINSFKEHSGERYNGLNVIVTLKDDRLKLPEYVKFKGLKCEIQLTTALYHTWAELEHDVLYKDKNHLKQFDESYYSSIEGAFSNVMKAHIKPAQTAFNFIFQRVYRAKEGQVIFTRDFIANLLSSSSKNELHEKLRLLALYIKEFGDKTPKDINSVAVVRHVLDNIQNISTSKIKTFMGYLAGKETKDIVEVCLEILEPLKYVYPQEITEILFDHYSKFKDAETLKKLDRFCEDFLQYDFDPKSKKVYFNVQRVVLDFIKNRKVVLRGKYQKLAILFLSHLLSPSFQGTSQGVNENDDETFTLHQGGIPVNHFIKKIRAQSIRELIKCYRNTADLKNKMLIVEALGENSTQLPNGGYTDELEKTLKQNVDTIVAFYNEIYKHAPVAVLALIDQQLKWFIRRFSPGHRGANALRKKLGSLERYRFFRKFVGHDYDYDEELGWEKAQQKRMEGIQMEIANVTDKKLTLYQNKISALIQDKRVMPNTGQYRYLEIFFIELAKQKPRIALKTFSWVNKKFSDFIPYTLAGLWLGGNKAVVRKKIHQWIHSGNNLNHCASFFSLVGIVDISLLNKIFIKAKQLKDTSTCVYIINSLTRASNTTQQSARLFIKVIQYLNQCGNTDWTFYLHHKGGTVLLKKLKKKDWEKLLNTVIPKKSVDYSLEEMLALPAAKWPRMVIDFFDARVNASSLLKRGMSYDAIPYRLDSQLAVILRQNSEDVLNHILKWFTKSTVHKFEASHLIRAIFGNIGDPLKKYLLKLVHTRDKHNVDVVIRALNAYEDQPFILDVIEELVSHKLIDDKLNKKIFHTLSKTGVVTGEFGFVEAYEKKKKIVEHWKKSKSKVVREFYAQYSAYLEELIVKERSMAEERVATRKLARQTP